MLKELLKKSVTEDKDVALMFSGGIDGCIVYNVLNEMGINTKLYCVNMENNMSDDYISVLKFQNIFNISFNEIKISKEYNLKKHFQELIDGGIPKRKVSSLTVMSLFLYTIPLIKENVIYTGLGSDSYYGLGRDFSIQCRLHGHKIPDITDMHIYRDKVFSHYMNQYKVISKIAKDKFGKTLIAPFLNWDVYNFMLNKSYVECNKPKKKQILIDLYPEFFSKFPPRNPSNFQCGNSNFKNLIRRENGKV